MAIGTAHFSDNVLLSCILTKARYQVNRRPLLRANIKVQFNKQKSKVAVLTALTHNILQYILHQIS